MGILLLFTFCRHAIYNVFYFHSDPFYYARVYIFLYWNPYPMFQSSLTVKVVEGTFWFTPFPYFGRLTPLREFPISWSQPTVYLYHEHMIPLGLHPTSGRSDGLLLLPWTEAQPATLQQRRLSSGWTRSHMEEHPLTALTFFTSQSSYGKWHELKLHLAFVG